MECCKNHKLYDCPVYEELKAKHEALFALLQTISLTKRRYMWQVINLHMRRYGVIADNHIEAHRRAGTR